MRQFQRSDKSKPPVMSQLKLRLTLGMACATRGCLAVDSDSGTLAYPASGVAVLLDIVHSKQKNYIHQGQQAISCLNFSPDGTLLLIGEVGYMPALRVWWIKQETEFASFHGHQYGIVSAAFSKRMDFVVSVGSKHDSFINVWAWPSRNKIACNRFAEDIFAMSFSNHISEKQTYFVTCGVHHIKFWYPLAKKRVENEYFPLCPYITTLHGRPAILREIKNLSFVDIACGTDRSEEFVYSVTKCGVVCQLSAERGVNLYKKLQNTQLSSLQVHDDQLMVGSLCGHVYFFDALSLEFKVVVSLPLDVCFAQQVVRSTSNNLKSVMNESRASTYLALDHKHHLLTAALSNGSMCVWDISDWNNITKKYYSISHSKAITGLDVMRSDKKRKETIVTVSHDATVRLWEMSVTQGICCESSKTIYTQFDELKGTVEQEPLGLHESMDFSEDRMITAVKISPEQDLVATGDSKGAITVYNRDTLENVRTILRHTRGVTALCMFTSKESNLKLMASGGRDRTINIFSIDSDFSLLNSLHIHSGTVTSVCLCSSLKRISLISSGLDRSLVLCNSKMRKVPQFKPFRCRHTNSSVIDIVMCEKDDQIGVGRISGELSVMEISTCSQIRRFNICPNTNARLEKLQLDPESSLLLSACSDRSINVLSFTLGVVLASVHGHARPVSGLQFSLNRKFIVSTSKDGCILIWGLPGELVQRGIRLSQSLANRSTTAASVKGDNRSGIISLSDHSLPNTIINLGNAANVDKQELQRVVTVNIEKPAYGSPEGDGGDEDDETGFLEDFSATEDITNTIKSDERLSRSNDEHYFDEDRMITTLDISTGQCSVSKTRSLCELPSD